MRLVRMPYEYKTQGFSVHFANRMIEYSMLHLLLLLLRTGHSTVMNQTVSPASTVACPAAAASSESVTTS